MLHGWGVLPGRTHSKNREQSGWGVLPGQMHTRQARGWGVLLGLLLASDHQFATTTYSAGWGVLPGRAHKPTIQIHMAGEYSPARHTRNISNRNG